MSYRSIRIRMSMNGQKTLAVMPALMIVALVSFLSGCGMDMSDGSMGAPSSVAIPAINHDALYVVNGGGNSLSVINTSTNEVSGTIALKNAMFPHHIYMSPDRSILALAVPGMDLSGGHGGGGGHGGMAGAVVLLDALTGATKASRQLKSSNHNAVVAPDGKEIWTSQMAMAGTVLVLDGTTLDSIKSIPVGDMPAEVTFTPTGKYAFVANGMSDNVTVIDVATKSIVKTIPVGDGPVGAWPGSNGVMYVDNEDGKSLTAIDASTLEVLRTYDLGFMPGMASVGPDSTLWVTDAENGKVVLYPAASTTRSGELMTGAGAHGVAFSSDGKTAYVTNQGAGTVSIIAVATRVVSKTVTVGSKPNGLAFRPKP